MNLYILLSFLLALFFMLSIVWHAIQLKKRNKSGSFIGVELIFVLLVLLGMLIVQKTALDYEELFNSSSSYIQQNTDNGDSNLEQADKKNNESDLLNNLISMQANTLSVTVTIVTISCIIISVLTIYRERKTEVNNQKVEDSLKMLEKTESVIQEIAAISSVLLLNGSQKEFLLSIVKEEIGKQSFSKENTDIATAHFQMILLNLILGDQHYMPKNMSEIKKYDIIISCANEIIENEKSTNLSISFAYVERAHAAFQKLKTSTDTDDIEQIKKNIKTADDYVRCLNKITDTSGNINNLHGLVELWSGIAKIRINNMQKTESKKIQSECLNHFNAALNYFDKAIYNNENKKEFLNHKIVTLLRISDVVNGSVRSKALKICKAIKICKKINKIDSNYLKAYINHADAVARKIRLKLNGKYVWNADIQHKEFNFLEINPILKGKYTETKLLMSIRKYRDEALEAIQKAIAIDPCFANSYYKRVEINLLWVSINIWIKNQGKNSISPEELSRICESFDKDLQKATDLIGETVKIKCYKDSCRTIAGEVANFNHNTTNRKRHKKVKSKLPFNNF